LHHNALAIALANKLARIAWGAGYRTRRLAGTSRKQRNPEGASNCKLAPSSSGRRNAGLFRPDRRIAARAAGWRNDRHIARLRASVREFLGQLLWAGQSTPSDLVSLSLSGSARGSVGRGTLRRDGALLRHRCVGAQPVAFLAGRLAGPFEAGASLA